MTTAAPGGRRRRHAATEGRPRYRRSETFAEAVVASVAVGVSCDEPQLRRRLRARGDRDLPFAHDGAVRSTIASAACAAPTPPSDGSSRRRRRSAAGGAARSSQFGGCGCAPRTASAKTASRRRALPPPTRAPCSPTMPQLPRTERRRPRPSGPRSGRAAAARPPYGRVGGWRGGLGRVSVGVRIPHGHRRHHAAAVPRS